MVICFEAGRRVSDLLVRGKESGRDRKEYT